MKSYEAQPPRRTAWTTRIHVVLTILLVIAFILSGINVYALAAYQNRFYRFTNGAYELWESSSPPIQENILYNVLAPVLALAHTSTCLGLRKTRPKPILALVFTSIFFVGWVILFAIWVCCDKIIDGRPEFCHTWHSFDLSELPGILQAVRVAVASLIMVWYAALMIFCVVGVWKRGSLEETAKGNAGFELGDLDLDSDAERNVGLEQMKNWEAENNSWIVEERRENAPVEYPTRVYIPNQVSNPPVKKEVIKRKELIGKNEDNMKYSLSVLVGRGHAQVKEVMDKNVKYSKSVKRKPVVEQRGDL
ncbi:hypothetical protein G7Y89_g3953 [Cudoniella acicularis]|uniref:Uncharacterized protein n=1 Tax=Cudoniella acicularis TaxID=354080 RepID=A0A8H4RRM1_9HELO|nr:hypothetical protein G7Y89_g3953 [Cudoniella acicularis]